MENNMSIQSKFEVGDKVWALDEFGTYYESTITEIISWDKWAGFRYEVRHNGVETKYFNVIETAILLSRQDIIDNKIIPEVIQNDQNDQNDQAE